ncbi:hypothetical protein B0H13DRAFT_1864532 [Mycena leptocephala]|nr:hypothetical protein B0H13DRAFT_1864532 [Mycena leptocephala]
MPAIKSATQSIARRPSSFFVATVLHAAVSMGATATKMSASVTLTNGTAATNATATNTTATDTTATNTTAKNTTATTSAAANQTNANGDRDEPEVDIDDCDLQPPPNKLNGLSSAHPGLPMNGAGRFSATSGPVGVQHRKERRERRRLYVDVPTLKLFFGGGIDNLLQCDQHSTVDAVGALERSAGTIGATSNNQMHSYSVGGAADKLRRKRLNTCKTPARQDNEVLLTDGVIKSISELTGRLDCVEKTLQLDPYPFFEHALDQRQGQAYSPGEFNGPPSGSSTSEPRPENSPPAHRAVSGDASFVAAATQNTFVENARALLAILPSIEAVCPAINSPSAGNYLAETVLTYMVAIAE